MLGMVNLRLLINSFGSSFSNSLKTSNWPRIRANFFSAFSKHRCFMSIPCSIESKTALCWII